MTNIYNKTVLGKNGTLIGNWWEEKVLKEVSGEGRTIPGIHVPKRHLDFDNPIDNPYPKNNTTLRIIGTKQETQYLKANDNYGDFSCPENKYKKITINEKIFHDFFKTFIRNDGSERAVMEQNADKLRNTEIFKRQEKTQTFVEMPEIYNNTFVSSKNKEIKSLGNSNFSGANSDMESQQFKSSKNNSKSNFAFAGNIDSYMPYYLEKENNYWSGKLEKNINNNVSKDRINTFVNTAKVIEVQNAKTTSKLLEVITPKINSKFGYFDEFKNEAYEKSHVLQSSSAFYNTFDFYASIKFKIISECIKRGWIGLRKLRLVLKHLTKGKNDFIQKVNFKYLFSNYGIVFDDKEIDYIFQTYENEKKGEVNFNDFLDNFNFITENRLTLVLKFFNQLKNNKALVDYKSLENNFTADKHPEVLSYKKTIAEVKLDLSSTWDILRENNTIKEENFVYYFRDISACIASDEEYLEILLCM